MTATDSNSAEQALVFDLDSLEEGRFAAWLEKLRGIFQNKGPEAAMSELEDNRPDFSALSHDEQTQFIKFWIVINKALPESKQGKLAVLGGILGVGGLAALWKSGHMAMLGAAFSSALSGGVDEVKTGNWPTIPRGDELNITFQDMTDARQVYKNGKILSGDPPALQAVETGELGEVVATGPVQVVKTSPDRPAASVFGSGYERVEGLVSIGDLNENLGQLWREAVAGNPELAVIEELTDEQYRKLIEAGLLIEEVGADKPLTYRMQALTNPVLGTAMDGLTGPNTRGDFVNWMLTGRSIEGLLETMDVHHALTTTYIDQLQTYLQISYGPGDKRNPQSSGVYDDATQAALLEQMSWGGMDGVVLDEDFLNFLTAPAQALTGETTAAVEEVVASDHQPAVQTAFDGMPAADKLEDGVSDIAAATWTSSPNGDMASPKAPLAGEVPLGPIINTTPAPVIATAAEIGSAGNDGEMADPVAYENGAGHDPSNFVNPTEEGLGANQAPSPEGLAAGDADEDQESLQMSSTIALDGGGKLVLKINPNQLQKQFFDVAQPGDMFAVTADGQVVMTADENGDQVIKMHANFVTTEGVPNQTIGYLPAGGRIVVTTSEGRSVLEGLAVLTIGEDQAVVFGADGAPVVDWGDIK